MSMYEGIKILLPTKARLTDIVLESSCQNLNIDIIKKIAKTIDERGNFVFSIDKKHILRQLNLYIHSFDREELIFICEHTNINRRVIPLDNKWFLNISMSQTYAIVKSCYPYLIVKRHLFTLFLEFYEQRKNVESSEDFEKLGVLLNKLKDDVYAFKKNSRR